MDWSRLLPGDRTFLAATVASHFEQVEQPACVRARQRIQTVGLSIFDGICRSHTFGAKLRRLLLHQRLPPQWVQFPDEHVDAHFGDRLDVSWSFLPQIPWERRDRQEVIGIQRGHVK